MNQTKEALEYLMKYNKKAQEDATKFINELEGSLETEYWMGQKFHAEMNIKILQSFGISAQDS